MVAARLREKNFNFLTREQEENLVSLSSKSVNQTANEALECFLFRTNGTTERIFNQRSILILLKLAAHYLVNEKRLAEPLTLSHIFISITDLGSSNYIGMPIPRPEGSASAGIMLNTAICWTTSMQTMNPIVVEAKS